MVVEKLVSFAIPHPHSGGNLWIIYNDFARFLQRKTGQSGTVPFDYSYLHRPSAFILSLASAAAANFQAVAAYRTAAEGLDAAAPR